MNKIIVAKVVTIVLTLFLAFPSFGQSVTKMRADGFVYSNYDSEKGRSEMSDKIPVNYLIVMKDMKLIIYTDTEESYDMVAPWTEFKDDPSRKGVKVAKARYVDPEGDE
jgi:hypothetical protein